MDIAKVVDNVVGDLVKEGFPNPVPKVMSVVGGRDDVRHAIAEELHKRTGSDIKEGANGYYSITLPFFIQKYDPSLC